MISWLRRGGAWWRLMGIATALGCGSAGCASPPPSGASGTTEIHATEYHRVFDAAVRVLREEGMRVDRQDARFGVITTVPHGSPTMWEPWRSGNRSLGQALDSTVNDQRRRTTVSLTPQADSQEARADTHEGIQVVGMTGAEAPTAYLLRVDVQVERHAAPVHYITQSMAGNAVMRSLRATPEELKRRNIAGRYWQPLGRDVALEGRLVAAIIRASMVP